MKATGIVRKVDELGRIVVPMETRRTHGIKTGDAIEIFVNDNQVVLRKYEPGCFFCGNVDTPVRNFKGKAICIECEQETVALI